MPGEDGIVLHSFSWGFLLLDYNAVEIHDTSALDDWTIDGDYIFKNASHAVIYNVNDSDEAFIASWGPLNVKPYPLDKAHLFGSWGKGALFRAAFKSHAFDPLKRRIFFETVRWHSRPLNERWTAAEDRATRILGRYVRPPGGEPNNAGWREWTWFLAVVGKAEAARYLPAFVALWYGLNHRRLKRAIRGDAAALRWVWWSLCKLAAVLAGQEFRVPKPHVPGP